MSDALTKEDFEALQPHTRGYAVYMCGSRDDQPNVPDEKNPYPEGSKENEQWANGAMAACIEAQESDGG